MWRRSRPNNFIFISLLKWGPEFRNVDVKYSNPFSVFKYIFLGDVTESSVSLELCNSVLQVDVILLTVFVFVFMLLDFKRFYFVLLRVLGKISEILSKVCTILFRISISDICTHSSTINYSDLLFWNTVCIMLVTRVSGLLFAGILRGVGWYLVTGVSGQPIRSHF